MAIVKPNYLPLRAGKQCAGHLAASADYYGRRPGPDRERGESRTWLADDGRPLEEFATLVGAGAGRRSCVACRWGHG